MEIDVSNAIYGQRIAKWRKSAKMSQRMLQAVTSVSQGYISDIETGRSGPSREFLAILSEKFGLNPAWVIEGHEPMVFDRSTVISGRNTVIEAPDSTRPGHGDLRIHGKDYAWVRRMGLSVSAGSGLEPVAEDDQDGMLLPIQWFERRGINSDLCVIVGVRGESMSPAIPNGALVLIDCYAKNIDKTGVFAFSLEGQSYVKRIVPSGRDKHGRPQALMLVSDNPAFAPVLLTGNDMNSLKVAGKVKATFTMLDD